MFCTSSANKSICSSLLKFKNEFLIQYNAIASNSSPGLDDYEISVYLTKAQLELEAQRKGFKIQASDVVAQKESDRLKVVAEQYSALTQFLSGQIFKSDYTLAGASNAVRTRVARSILG